MSRAVVVLCPNGRREIVKVTPNDSILQVLEEACKKQKLNPDDYDICHYNKPLDLSLPIRFANVPNNALLELHPAKGVRRECMITVGLQLESGERIMKDFLPSDTIWNVVETCLNSRTDVISSEDGSPICIYMRQKLVGDSLRTTTLRSLGLTKGSAVIRLLYRKPEELNKQAHISAPLSKSPPEPFVSEQSIQITEQQVREMQAGTWNKNAFSEKEDNKDFSYIQQSLSSDSFKTNERTHLLENSNNFSEKKPVKSMQNIKTEPAYESEMHAALSNKKDGTVSVVQCMEIDDSGKSQNETPVEDFGPINYIGERHAVLYSLDDVTDVKKADIPDEFFELTVDDVKYLMQEYKKNRHDLENQPLLTKEQRKRNMLQNLAHYRQTVLRIYFPDKLVLQAVFKIDETIQMVCDFIRNYLEDKNLNFYLYITPPKEKLNPSKTMLQAMLVPAAVVYFGCETQPNYYLMNSLRNKISDPRAAALAASESRKDNVSKEPVNITIDNSDDTLADNEDATSSSTDDVLHPVTPTPPEKIPKWLKLSKK